MNNNEWLEFEWVVKYMIKKLNIKKDLDVFYNLGLFTLYESMNQFNPDKQIKLSTFLYMRVKYSFMNELNERNRHKEIPCDWNSSILKTTENPYNMKEWELLIKTLPLDLEKILELKIQGFSEHEISQLLYPSLTEDAAIRKVKYRLFKLRKWIREEWRKL